MRKFWSVSVLVTLAILALSGCVLINGMIHPWSGSQGTDFVVQADGSFGSTWGSSYSGWIAMMLPKGCTPESLVYSGDVSGTVYDTSQAVADTASLYHPTDPGMDWWGLETIPHNTTGGNYDATLYISIHPAADTGSFLLDYLTGTSYNGASWADSMMDIPFSITAAVGIEDEPDVTRRIESAGLRIEPNPVRSATTINISIPRDVFHAGSGESAVYSLRVYDTAGRLVRNLAPTEEGDQVRIAWDGSDSRGSPLGSGVFFLRFEMGNLILTEPVVIVR